MNHSQKVAIITGGTQGIGSALVSGFAEAGYAVLSVDLDSNIENQNVKNFSFDLTNTQSLKSVIDKCLEEFGTVDTLINNAAVSLGKSVLETDQATWEKTMAINVTAPFFLSREAALAMSSQKKSGSIINMASVNSFAAEKGHASYVVSKGGIAAMSRSMAVDLAPQNIRVNAIAPGPIETNKTSKIFAQPDYASAIKKGIPLARAGRPSEVADLALFLASDQARYITGQVIKIDGGYLSYARLD